MPIKVKTYADTDTNQNGTSRKQWRLIHLEGDDEFLESISVYPDDHFFALGAAGIQIRGGTRAESKKSKGKAPNPQAPQPIGINIAAISKVLEKASDEVLQNEEKRERNEFSATSGKKNKERSE